MDFYFFKKLTHKGKIIGFHTLTLWTPLVKKFNFLILVCSRVLHKRGRPQCVYSFVGISFAASLCCHLVFLQNFKRSMWNNWAGKNLK